MRGPGRGHLGGRLDEASEFLQLHFNLANAAAKLWLGATAGI